MYLLARGNKATTHSKRDNIMSKLNLSEIFKAAHALAKSTVQTGDSYSATFAICLKIIYSEQSKSFDGTAKQIAWAKDAYSRYAKDAKQGVSDLQVLADTDLRQNLQEAIIMTSVGSIRPLTNQQELDSLCVEINDAIESMTTLNWIHFDQAFKGAKKSQQMLSLYTQAINIIKAK